MDTEDAASVSTQTGMSRKLSSEDELVLRKYRVRKGKRWIRRCKDKGIKFPKRICRISSDLIADPESVSDAALAELTQECLDALGSDTEMRDDEKSESNASSSD